MRRPAATLLCLLCLLTCAPARSSAAQACLVARVTTEKGALNLRSSAQDNCRVLEKIPCGTCILVTGESGDWCQAVYHQQTGFCKRSFLTFLPDADPALLNYRILRQGDRGEDVLQVKRRLQELGYIRQGSSLTDVYNRTAAERVALFQRQTGFAETGIASQELQLLLFSSAAPVCTQALPKVQARSRTASAGDTAGRVVCGCCDGTGCSCCGYTGWITN